MTYDRRALLAHALAGYLVAAAPISALATVIPPRLPTFPARLKRGDTAAIVAPAGVIYNKLTITMARESLEAMGLTVKVGQHVLARHGYLAGTDKQRADDLNAAFEDKDVKAVFCLRGGWGCARMLPFVDFAAIARNPKALIGYSDVTTLLNAVYAKTGLITFHGPNGDSPWRQASWNAFKALLFDGKTPHLANEPVADGTLAKRLGRAQTLRSGTAEGRLIGGNLTLITNLLGTPYLPDMQGHILCIEEVDEAIYRCDRMLTQLSNAGVFDQVAGVVLGTFSGCGVQPGGRISGFTLMDVFENHFGQRGIPSFFGLNFGHIQNKFTLPFGVRVSLDADAHSIALLETSVR